MGYFTDAYMWLSASGSWWTIGEQIKAVKTCHLLFEPMRPWLLSSIEYRLFWLTHWGRVMPICVSKLAIICSDNGLPGGQYWNLLIGPLGTNSSEFLNQNWYVLIQENAFENVVCKMAAILSRLQCVKLILSLAIGSRGYECVIFKKYFSDRYLGHFLLT